MTFLAEYDAWKARRAVLAQAEEDMSHSSQNDEREASDEEGISLLHEAAGLIREDGTGDPGCDVCGEHDRSEPCGAEAVRDSVLHDLDAASGYNDAPTE